MHQETETGMNRTPGFGLFRTAGLDLCSSLYEKLNTLNTNLAA